VEPRLIAKNLNLSWNIDFSGTALLDLDRMLRVLVNLSDNAYKACKRGGSITFSASEKKQHLILSVKDNGTGMDKETLAHVFEPFYSSSERGGTGLGMHIVKTVVEAHVGTVDISSKPGSGTEITISLPLRL
ncbi:MAG: ATP-binding protein, partial [Spirochaetaceae bacterium]|nr:ATP-binding protein [Spirochaetaceae bacterium]